MDDEPLLLICALAPRETQPKAETKILHLSILRRLFVNRAPGQTVVVYSDWLGGDFRFLCQVTFYRSWHESFSGVK